MSLNAQLTALLVPSGTEFPGTVQALLDLIAQYEEITGLENFTGINFGATTPDADNRDRPWFKTTGAGYPIGWFSWNGSSWVEIPQTLPVGITAERPTAPQDGEQFWDTQCGCAIVFIEGEWITLGGSSGDFKFVKAATIGEALAKNPRWTQDTDSLGRVVGSAGAGSGLTARAYGDQVGIETSILALDNLPSHQHTTYVSQTTRFSASTGNGATADGALAGWVDFFTGYFPTPGDDSQPFENMQPTVFFWGLVKS